MEWMAYGLPRESFREVQILAGRLQSFKLGVKVIQWGKKYMIFTYDKERAVTQ